MIPFSAGEHNLAKTSVSTVLRIFFLFLTVTIAVGLLVAQPSSRKNASFSLSPEELLETARSANPTLSNAVILVDEETLNFQSDGSLRKTSHLVVKVLSAGGIEEWASIARLWEPWRQTRPDIRARVVTPDGVAHKLDQQTIIDSPTGSPDPDTYSDARVVSCPLPAVSVNSVIEEEISEQLAPLIGTGILERRMIGWSVPVQSTRIVITRPRSLPFRYKSYLLPDLQVVTEIHSETVQLTMSIPPMPASKAIPPLMPSDAPVLPEIIFSTSSSWAENAEAYAPLVDRQIANAPVADLLVDGKNGASRVERIAPLLAKLQSEIRYTGVEFGDAAIAPARPGVTLKRKYGDCKDKALLFVSMLRAAGIPAHLALLNAGFSEDINPDFPGLDLFNHAIVFVPAASPSEPELWIDTTAAYLRLGFLPSADQGRLALIVERGTTRLKRIPESPSAASKTVETREFFFPDTGPARVVEVSNSLGTAEEWYRTNFGSGDTQEMRNDLRSYLQDEYVSDEHGIKIEHSKGDDFSKPFYLRLEIDKAKRGVASEMDGVVWIPFASLFNRLPAYLKSEKRKHTSEADDGVAARPPSADFVLPEAFTTEWHYRIHLPPGFHAKELPSPMSRHLGPALLTADYESDRGDIIATLKFDTIKRYFSPAEAEALRAAVVEIEKQSALPLTFESIGKTLLDGGRIREALSQFALLSAQYPKKAIFHIQMSLALSDAACGEEARKQALLATQLEPDSALAWRNLGRILSRDLIGRPFHKGFDIKAAEAAYRKAISLDSKDYATQGDLAILLEFDASGERYSLSARMNEAVELYLSIKDELPSPGLGNNLLYALAYARRFQALKEESEKLDHSAQRSQMMLIANSAISGTVSALKQFDSEELSAQDRSSAIQTASTVFLRLRMYDQAADLLQAAAQSSDQAAEIAARAQVLRKIKILDTSKLQMDSPLSAFLSMLSALSNGDDERLIYRKFLAREAIMSLSAPEQEKRNPLNEQEQMLRITSNRTGIPASVMLDLVGSLAQMTSDANGDDGFRVHFNMLGAPPATFYYVVEAAQYKLLGDDSDYSGIAQRVFEDVDQGKLIAARKWLDWLRDEIKLQSGDDPVAGPIFPRFWTKGERGDEKKIRYAAAVLVASSSRALEVTPLLLQGLQSADDPSSKSRFTLAYGLACLRSGKFSQALNSALDLARVYPDSITASTLVLQAFAGKSDWKQYESFARQRLEKNPDEPTYSRALAENAGLQGRFDEAESRYHDIALSSKGGVQDWNGFGWNALMAGKVTLTKILELQRVLNVGESQPQQAYPEALHTLAAMYSDVGKTKEAREIIFAAMDSWHIDEPNEACWLVLGRIAEQLGVRDSALADYRRIGRPQLKFQEKQSSYYLAQQRIAIMERTSLTRP